MRYRSDGPSVMDFLFASLFFYGKDQGFKRFNLGMAPLASVGRFQGAHARERLANLLFQHGENWYNFQGLRFYKDKFDPEWVPRYMAYQNAWEWPAAITNVSALVAGGWSKVIGNRERGRDLPADLAHGASVAGVDQLGQRRDLFCRRVNDRAPLLKRRRRPASSLSKRHATVVAHLDDRRVHRFDVQPHTNGLSRFATRG